MKIKVEYRKSKIALGILLSFVLLSICWISSASLIVGTVLAVFILVAASFRIDIPNTHVQIGLYGLLFLAFPAGTYILVQFVQNLEFLTVAPERILLNMGICLFLQMLLLLISANVRIALIGGCVIPVLLGIANDYLVRFRGNALTPLDFLSIRTAANVAAEYDFMPSAPAIYGFAFVIFISLCLFALPNFSLPKRFQTYLICSSITVVLGITIGFGCATQMPRRWMNYGAGYNGYILNFVLQLNDIYVDAPDGYDTDTIALLEDMYKDNTPDRNEYPDIIVIMDESFADFDAFGNTDCFGEKIMPYINSLQENTIRGYLHASSFGGWTANSEYEFLSGNSMAFLPEGSIAFQQYVSNESYSLVSILKEKGYYCIGMHPYYANSWMRNTVYPNLGFDETFFMESFPQKKVIREYISDEEMFEQIIFLDKNHGSDEPLFFFGVTMQNHGGYEYEGLDFQPTVAVEGYPMAEQYLTLAQETDRAVEYLIEHYKTVERDTVIVFFGDHMPNVEPAFYEELNGGPFDTLDEQMKKQMVPFFVWANFDIEEQEIPCSSINYLPLYTLEAAGLPLPPYIQFLKDTEAVIPAINAYGYYSLEKQGFQPLEDAAGAEAEAIEHYAVLQYNNLFDDANRSDHFFGK